MSVSFFCNQCGAELEADDSMVGTMAKCESCRNVFKVPDKMPRQRYVIDTSDATPTPFKLSQTETETRSEVYSPARPADADDATEQDAIPEAELLPATTGGARRDVANQRDIAIVVNMVERGKYLEAIQALKGMEASGASHPAFHYVRGLAFAGLGNNPQALESLTQAINGGIQNSQVYATKGRVELQLKHYAASIESLDTALEVAGTDVPDYMADLAKAYDGAKMPRDAAATWSALKQINPNHPALVEREQKKAELATRQHNVQVQEAMLQMQKEQKASDTACWICIILRCLLECA